MKSSVNVGALVIGGDFQGLGVIRSLAENGIPVFLLEHELSISRFSKYLQGRAFCENLLSPEKFYDYLVKLARNKNLHGWVLYPNNDETVKLLSINKEILSEYYRVPVPEWNVVKNFYIKRNAYRVANTLSIPIPRMYEGKNAGEILKNDIRYPIVLKPCFKENYFPKTRNKAVRANDKASFIREYEKMASFIPPSDIVVQEMVEGGPKNLYSYCAFFDGKQIVAGMSARRSRQHPMDFGQATTFAEAVDIPLLREYAEKILIGLSYYGIAEVEFMMDDKDGKYKFLEINGRPWGWHTLAKASGINTSLLLYQHMVNGNVDYNINYSKDVKWMRIITDVPTVAKELLKRRMGFSEYLDSYKGKIEFAVFSLRDPLPFFVEFLMIPYLWWKRGF